MDGLRKTGFRINMGSDDSGLMMMIWERAGGYYIGKFFYNINCKRGLKALQPALDIGCSQLIVDGKVKLKNDSQISHFSKNSIVFEDGSELPADVVICATGYGDTKGLVEQIAGPEVAKNVNPVWGLNKEGEINAVWRWSGVPRLYFMMGTLAQCRFYSKHLALREWNLYFLRCDFITRIS